MSDKKNKRKLFSEFPPIPTSQWEEIIHADLKGNDNTKNLIWNTDEGFEIRPYYREEDLKDKEYLDCLPGEYPYVRGTDPRSNAWEIRQDIRLNNVKEGNEYARFILDRGISSAGFHCLPDTVNSLLKTNEDFSRLLKGIPVESTGLYFLCGSQAPELLSMLVQEIDTRKIAKELIRGAMDYDPLGYLTLTGHYINSEEADFQNLRELILTADKNLPNYRILGINAHYLHNAGASIVQELGYGLSMAAEYFTKLASMGVPIDTVAQHIQLNCGIGSNYFLEIAKIRAARFLWAKIAEAYQVGKELSKKLIIHSVTSGWNQTIFDPYMNILRATTESMAAILGGADILSVLPFNSAYKQSDNFSDRLARNIQIILRKEAYFDKIADPAAGSYYIEILTDSIIREAWNIFLQVDENGGYVQALKKGLVQSDIEEMARTRDNQIATRKSILVGINQYPSADETIPNEIASQTAFPKIQTKTTIIKPLKIYRGAMEFEKLRRATEKNSFRPKVFLLPYGNVALRRARATFSANFFACAGYQIIDHPGFDSPEQGVKEAMKNKPHIMVLCSSDDEYAELAQRVHKMIGDEILMVIAGSPSCREDLEKLGIEYFIHMKSNVLEILKLFHHKLGIKL